ncbi:uncharacterized protein TRUGW13939_09737 [Talaromyces rugulosus]|uniref:Uncharacterized protein n=1 Tax=Talaromyces rugulosus TaxID=121627 RepID=A0A7H8R8I2_TALRU|nr:uncharacterized protein TRUGW13939_09737 [Talaromyces rugulosus]QKX62576.1 hypothetical protein TRUGW13939_09737 [Talaromyces rugulosus]
MPNGFPNFRSVPEVYHKPKKPTTVAKPSPKQVDSSSASFTSDAETLRDIPMKKSVFRATLDTIHDIMNYPAHRNTR